MKKQLQNISVTNLIIFLNIVMFVLEYLINSAKVIFGLNIYFFKYDLWYQPLSSMFIHGGIGHITMNMLVLYQFGRMIEPYMGKIRFAILYFVGGVFTSFATLAYMFLSTNWANVIGASGAICVLLGWYALRVPSERKAIMIWIVLISFAPLVIGLPIAWYAHIFGFIFGWIMGYFL